MQEREEGRTVLAAAVLREIAQAYAALLAQGQEYTLFLDKLSLGAAERQWLADFLGQGKVSIKLADGLEPAQWQETSFAGIWRGVYYNLQGHPALETLEIAWQPPLAAAQREDVRQGLAKLDRWLKEQGSPET